MIEDNIMHTNISDTPAGRELDLRIAREVFGLIEPERIYNWQRCQDGTWKTYGVWLPSTWPHHYSTDIAAAWEIVGKMLSDGVEVVVIGGFSGNLSACMMFNGCPASYPPRDAFLYLANKDTFTATVRVQADTVPLAICRAALMVVEQCREDN